MQSTTIDIINNKDRFTNKPKRWTIDQTQCEALADRTSLPYQVINVDDVRGCSIDTQETINEENVTSFSSTIYYNTYGSDLSRYQSSSNKTQIYNNREPWCDRGTSRWVKCRGWTELSNDTGCTFHESQGWQQNEQGQWILDEARCI